MIVAALMAAIAPASAPACSPDTATRTTVAEIGGHVERFLGRCVTVEGPFGSIALYGAPDDLYLVHRSGISGNPDPVVASRARIGLYSKDNELRQLRPSGEGIPHIRVTGTVDTCERKRVAAEARESRPGQPAIIMMTGYCHYYAGAVLDVASYSLDLTRRYERQMGVAARRALGDLVEMPADWPFARELRRTADAFLAALRSGNRDEMAALHGFTPGSDNEYDRKVMRLLFDQTDSPFAQIRRSKALPMKIYVSQAGVLQHAAGQKLSFPAGTACFCRTADCRHRWPISSNDGDNWISRPYACVHIRKQDWPGGRMIVETPVGSGGWLKEPARTAFHGG
jgi:hypothetical protein